LLEVVFGIPVQKNTSKNVFILGKCKDNFCVFRYRVDEVCYTDELSSRLEKFSESKLLLLNGTNSDSGKQTRAAAFDGMAAFKTDDKVIL